MEESLDLLILNAKIVTANKTIPNGFLTVKQDLIHSVGAMDQTAEIRSAKAQHSIDAGGQWLLPGFIDVHVHGGYGCDFMDAKAEALETITRFHSKHGTTTMLATTVTASRDALQDVLACVHAYQQNGMPYARLAGVHFEGPFINLKRHGAQNPKFIVPPNLEWMDQWAKQFPGLIRILTLAPEMNGAGELMDLASRHGIIVACGHTDASYDQITEAMRYGLRHAVHMFNAMTGLHHREPGAAGAILDHDQISAEVIADGRHVHPACIRLLHRLKPNHNLLLITDAISAAGLGDGVYHLGGLSVTVHDGAARLTDGDSLAGSTLTMIDAFQYMVNVIGISVESASRLASGNPANLIGMEKRTGSIESGKFADLLLLAPDLSIEKLWVQGKDIS